jgi:hypothetical protein
MTPCEATTFVVVGMKVITPPSSVEVNYALRYASFLPCAFMAWCLIKHMDNFAFTYAVVNSEQGYVITVVKNG